MISSTDIQAIKDMADISDFITRSGVSLKRGGVNSLKGLCPFHDEKTPSFTVRPTHQHFRCWGCGESGDVLQYVQKKEGMTFVEAVRFVAQAIGYTLTEDEEEDTGPSRRRLYQLMRTASEFYVHQFAHLPDSHPAKEELRKRDLLLFAEETFCGYAPQGWTHLHDYLAEQGYSDEEMIACGVVNIHEESQRVYDVYRGRLIFPIKNISGNVIGFGARKIFDDDKGPKYLNTSDTALYHKFSVLYGIDTARAEAAKTSTMHVVEGYTDVMAYRAAGIHNVVASCGTAFGEEHARIVKGIIGESGTIVFGFDGDNAGKKAARKTFELKAPIHSRAKVVPFTNGDPDDVRRTQGNSGLIETIKNQIPLVEFVLRLELEKFNNAQTPEDRSQYLEVASDLLAGLNDVSLREDYVRKVSLWSGSTLSTVQTYVQQKSKRQNSYNSAPPVEVFEDDFDAGQDHAQEHIPVREKQLLALFLQHPLAAQRALVKIKIDASFFSSASLQEIANRIFALLKSNKIDEVEKLQAHSFENGELFEELLYCNIPALDRLVSLGADASLLASAERMTVTAYRGIVSERKKTHALTVKRQVLANLEGSDNIDLLREADPYFENMRF